MQPTIHLVFSSSHSPSPILFSKTNTGSITTSVMAQTIRMSGSSLTDHNQISTLIADCFGKELREGIRRSS